MSVAEREAVTTAGRILTTAGIGLSLIASILFAQATRTLFRATGQYDGILPENVARAKRWAVPGWIVLGTGLVVQLVAVWL